jgi:malate/lactate dehydrogenase
MQTPKKIAIVGSGLVGSLLAIYLPKQAIPFTYMIEVPISGRFSSRDVQ